MANNPALEPRTDEYGSLERTCLYCGKAFRTNNIQAKYDTEECRKAARNKRYYERHKEVIIKKVIKRRKGE